MAELPDHLSMSAWKLLALYAAWLVAAAAIAIAGGGFVAMVADAVGFDGARLLFDVIAVAIFVGAAALPFLIRGRTTGGDRTTR